MSRLECLSALKKANEEVGRINVDEDKVLSNVRASIRLGLPQVRPETLKRQKIALVCGGPSLKTTLPELRQQVFEGHKVVAVNGAANWLVEQNIRPSAQIVMDARPGNAAFIGEPIPSCKYFLASQCDPTVFERMRGREAYIFHALTYGESEKAILDAYYMGHHCPVTGGTTAGVRSLALLRTIGFMLFDIYGLDSCWLDDEHHAFDQPLNHKDLRIKVETAFRREGKAEVIDFGRRVFECAPWHMQQVADFQNLIRDNGEHFRIRVHGEGLIAYMMRTGAEIMRQTED